MKTKKQFKLFTIFEYEKEQDYLQDMHKSGWKFVRVKGFGMYHFEECASQNFVYQLDYNKEGLTHKEEYLQMFKDCGWEYIQDFAGYSYFRKPIEEEGLAEGIFCDEQSRLQMMERVIKARMITLIILLFCCVLLQFVIKLLGFSNYLVNIFIGSIFAIYVATIAMCTIKYSQYKNSVKE